MMEQTVSSVLAFPTATPADMAQIMYAKLCHYTDAWDVAEDLANGIAAIVVGDTRSIEHYRAGHIPGAISLPHREMAHERLSGLDRSKVYVTYCDGIGCNGSTKGAWKLASAGLKVKELLGGLDFWRRDGHPVQTDDLPGNLAKASVNTCGC